MERWAGKVAVVTGASSGIGRAIAKDLVKHGMKVAALARRKDRLEELEKEINKKDQIKGLICDVSKKDEVKAAINWVETNWGEINVLINNAGKAAMAPVAGGTGEELSSALETNVIGLSTCFREVCAVMKKRNVQQASIIVINSILGHTLALGAGPYVASKHAVTVLTETLRNELILEKSPIRVTSLSPGLVDTEMTTQWMQHNLPHLEASDISNCVMFVLGLPDNVNIAEMTVLPRGELLPCFSFGNLNKDH
ncbi:hypothetical protein O3M35_008834 [Rhynocoris fuscipes]|uniref:Dehydrogenase/reductase SDR family member 11 n=1 Tax=Rhynocoris fuscipes TaxID=488301 RepID=A0AAW1DD99_9HEMI